MNRREYVSHDAVGLAQLIKDGQVTAAEVETAAREALERVNGDVNGLVGAPLDEAADYNRDGRLAGIPFLIKDAGAPVSGVPYTICSRLLGSYVPDRDSEMARRFKHAGLAIIGRTATPEFTLHWNTTSVVNGPTRNPWNLDRVSGGSSGGAAALVAAGAVPVAHGNDAAGSIRMPAACCGVVGLKPTRSRVPMEQSVIGDELNHDFVLTRTVRDSAAVLDLVHGPTRWSRYEIAPPERPYLDELDRDVEPLKVAYLDTSGSAEVSPATTQAVRAVADVLAGDGHEVEPGALPAPQEEVGRYPLTDIATYLASWVDRVAELGGVTPSADNLESVIWQTYQLGRDTPAVELRLSWSDRLVNIATVRDFFERHDLFVSPVVISEAPPIEGAVTLDDDVDDPVDWFVRMSSYMPFTSIFNVSGHPAVSLPVGTSEDGLPVGVQLVAAYGEEARLLRLARRLETEFNWAERVPEVWAGN